VLLVESKSESNETPITCKVIPFADINKKKPRNQRQMVLQ
jgi:hypothetical protein